MASTSSILNSSPFFLKKSFACSRLQNSFVKGALRAMISCIFASIFAEVVGMERLRLGEVVVEAVLDHRADGHLGAGPQRLHGLRHHVRRIVPDELERLGIGARHDLDRRVGLDRVGEIGQLAVHHHGHGALGQRLGDALGQLLAGDALAHRALGAVRKCQGDLVATSLMGVLSLAANHAGKGGRACKRRTQGWRRLLVRKRGDRCQARRTAGIRSVGRPASLVPHRCASSVS